MTWILHFRDSDYNCFVGIAILHLKFIRVTTIIRALLIRKQLWYLVFQRSTNVIPRESIINRTTIQISISNKLDVFDFSLILALDMKLAKLCSVC